MNWGGRLQAHSQWDNNGESWLWLSNESPQEGDAENGVTPHTHATSDSHASSFCVPLEISFSLCPRIHLKIPVSLSRRATPLFSYPSALQILFKAEMIHRAAEFAINISRCSILSAWSPYMELIGLFSHSRVFLRTLLICVSVAACELAVTHPRFALRFDWATSISPIWPILHQSLDLPPCLFGVYLQLLWWSDITA